jgi:hypothetical protein
MEDEDGMATVLAHEIGHVVASIKNWHVQVYVCWCSMLKMAFRTSWWKVEHYKVLNIVSVLGRLHTWHRCFCWTSMFRYYSVTHINRLTILSDCEFDIRVAVFKKIGIWSRPHRVRVNVIVSCWCDVTDHVLVCCWWHELVTITTKPRNSGKEW